MKQGLILFFCIASLTSVAQQKDSSRYPLVQVKDWKEASYSLTEDFWESTEKEILSKIDASEFAKIKKYSNNENKPVSMLLFDGNRKVQFEEYLKRLGSLKVYKVVEFTQEWQGTNYGTYAILSVPYQELYWDKSAKWDTVYFVVKAYVVEDIKN